MLFTSVTRSTIKARAFSTSIAARSDLSKVAINHLAAGVGRASNVVVDKAQGSWVYSGDKKYLDFTAGIGVVNTGHCHPTVVKAAQEQCGNVVHAQCNIYLHNQMMHLINELLEVMPDKKLDSFFFWNSGAEAVEAAIKLARHATGKTNVIAVQGGYHGRTLGTMSLTTSKTIYRAGYGPLMPGVFVTPFPYATQYPQVRPEQLDEFCLDQLSLLLKQQTTKDETAAFIMEPVLGEGGYIAASQKYMDGVMQICKENDILFIADEVQSGFGRTGKMFAVEHYGITPDIMTMAKGLASGFPLSAIVSRKELMDRQPPGSQGGTYAGNAVSCAAARATLKVFREENVLQNTVERGQQLTKGLNKLKEKYPISDVRGNGLMIGIEFDAPAGTTKKIADACFEQDMYLLSTSAYEVMRFIPTLTVTKEEIDLGLEKFEKALEKVFI